MHDNICKARQESILHFSLRRVEEHEQWSKLFRNAFTLNISMLVMLSVEKNVIVLCFFPKNYDCLNAT